MLDPSVKIRMKQNLFYLNGLRKFWSFKTKLKNSLKFFFFPTFQGGFWNIWNWANWSFPLHSIMSIELPPFETTEFIPKSQNNIILFQLQNISLFWVWNNWNLFAFKMFYTKIHLRHNFPSLENSKAPQKIQRTVDLERIISTPSPNWNGVISSKQNQAIWPLDFSPEKSSHLRKSQFGNDFLPYWCKIIILNVLVLLLMQNIISLSFLEYFLSNKDYDEANFCNFIWI